MKLDIQRAIHKSSLQIYKTQEQRSINMKLNLGTTIRELRRRDARTQEELAILLGVTAQAVSRWESGVSQT